MRNIEKTYLNAVKKCSPQRQLKVSETKELMQPIIDRPTYSIIFESITKSFYLGFTAGYNQALAEMKKKGDIKNNGNQERTIPKY